jgi:hypothetical protein
MKGSASRPVLPRGLATNLECLTAQGQLLLAQLQMASERYNLKVAYLNL